MQNSEHLQVSGMSAILTRRSWQNVCVAQCLMGLLDSCLLQVSPFCRLQRKGRLWLETQLMRKKKQHGKVREFILPPVYVLSLSHNEGDKIKNRKKQEQTVKIAWKMRLTRGGL